MSYTWKLKYVPRPLAYIFNIIRKKKEVEEKEGVEAPPPFLLGHGTSWNVVRTLNSGSILCRQITNTGGSVCELVLPELLNASFLELNVHGRLP